jgi:hypothetical protein
MRLPADYVNRHLEQGYASTIHRVQGITVGTAHLIVDSHDGREALYVAATRGRLGGRPDSEDRPGASARRSAPRPATRAPAASAVPSE